MPTPTERNGFRKPDPGSDNNTWGLNLNTAVFDLVDQSLDGWVEITASGSTTLTSTQYIENQSRMRVIKYSGNADATLIVPNVEKWYIVYAVTDDVIVTANSAVTATVRGGDISLVFCDGTDVRTLQIGGQDLKDYIDGQAFGSTNLPGITPSTAGQFVGNDGVTALWASAGFNGVTTATSNQTLTVTDKEKVFRLSGTFTISFAPIASLGSKFSVVLKNEGTGDITLDPSGAETIDGLATYIMYPGESRLVVCNGTAITTVVLSSFFKAFTTNGTFVKPPGYSVFSGAAWGGGGSGAKGTAYSGGGGGGASRPFSLLNSVVPTTVAITIAAGAVGPSGTANGTAGGTTLFGSLVSSFGGGGGLSNGSSGGGGGITGVGGVTSGGEPLGGATGQPSTFGGGGGGNSSANTIGGFSVYGGGAGGGTTSGASLAVSGGESVYGGGGGGTAPGGAGGLSGFGGAGGAGSPSSSGVDGSAPGGGGGATNTGAKAGDGGRGELRIWGIT